ncbi:MAG: TdeIII family type II restriction endonuclease [Chloroflexi bacterium]|nr:TdeIII family type II restriction endonuclease [Chloroflexota bacterium]
MSLTREQCDEIYETLLRGVRKKLANYQRDTSDKPFHFRLLGKDRVEHTYFIQAINYLFGTSIFEQVAAIIARPHFRHAVNHYRPRDTVISTRAASNIQEIMETLEIAVRAPNKREEVERIIESSREGDLWRVNPPLVDLFVETWDGVEYYIDLVAVKPSFKQIRALKLRLLEWIAIRATRKVDTNIFTMLAIPYNPYAPEPYHSWPFDGMLDSPNELLIADKLWDFLGGEETYSDLLVVFEQAGKTLRPEINRKFRKFIQ